MWSGRSSKRLFTVAWAIAATAMISPALAVVISVGSKDVAEKGDQAVVCVNLELEPGDRVVGTQNELFWDGACSNLVDNCAVHNSQRKPLMDMVDREATTQTAILFRPDDPEEMPSGPLYCCVFTVDVDVDDEVEEPERCCNLEVRAPRAFDPAGTEVDATAGAPGELCLIDPNAPTKTPEPEPTPTDLPEGTIPVPPSPTAAASSTPAPKGEELNGCAVEPSSSVDWLPWLLAGLLATARYRSRRA